MHKRVSFAALYGGLVAGTLDIGVAARERSFGQGCLSCRGGWTGIGVRTAVGHVAGDRIDF
jgi:hypothetical protein